MNPINLQERIGQLAARWESQGRDEEHVYAVRNFLTGAGNTDIRQLIQDVCLEAVGEKRSVNTQEYKQWPDVTNGYNEAVTEIRQNIKRLVGK